MTNKNTNILETAQLQMLLCEEDWMTEPMEENRARENIKKRKKYVQSHEAFFLVVTNNIRDRKFSYSFLESMKTPVYATSFVL